MYTRHWYQNMMVLEQRVYVDQPTFELYMLKMLRLLLLPPPPLLLLFHSSIAYASQTIFSRPCVTVVITQCHNRILCLCFILFKSILFFPFPWIKIKSQFSIQSLDIEITKPTNAYHMIIECQLKDDWLFLEGVEGGEVSSLCTCIHFFFLWIQSSILSRQMNEKKNSFLFSLNPCKLLLRMNKNIGPKVNNKYHVKAVWPIYLYQKCGCVCVCVCFVLLLFILHASIKSDMLVYIIHTHTRT